MEAKIVKLMQRKAPRAPQVPDFRTILETIASDLDDLVADREAVISAAVDAIAHHLRRGNSHRALDRVESMAMTKNTVDALLQVKGYCSLLKDAAATILDDRIDCPQDLMEAVAGVLFASQKLQADVRCFEEIRQKFTSRFGLDFVRSTSSGNFLVDNELMERLSNERMSAEEKLEVIKEIASEEGIEVDLDDLTQSAEEERMNQDSGRSTSTSNETYRFDGIGDDHTNPKMDSSSAVSKEELEEDTRGDRLELPHGSISSSSISSANTTRKALGSKHDGVGNLWNPAREKFKNAYRRMGTIPKNFSSAKKKSSAATKATTGDECTKETSKQGFGEESTELHRSTSSSSLSSTNTLSATASPLNKDAESKKEMNNLSRKLWKPAVQKVKNVYQIMGTIPKNFSAGDQKSAAPTNNPAISAIPEDEDLSRIMAMKAVYKDAVTAAGEALRLANLSRRSGASCDSSI